MIGSRWVVALVVLVLAATFGGGSETAFALLPPEQAPAAAAPQGAPSTAPQGGPGAAPQAAPATAPQAAPAPAPSSSPAEPPSPAPSRSPAEALSPPPAAGTPPARRLGASNPQVLVGLVTRERVEAAVPAWVAAGVDAKPDLAVAQDLAAVPPGAEVMVLLGTWCSDSRREISRLWKAFDGIGATAGGGPGSGLPFLVTYVGVDEAKREPAAAVAAAGLKFVPTLIVRRDGREVGRIVEVPPHSIESDLLALLDGKATGLLTASPKLKAAGSAAPGAPAKPR